MRASIVRVVAVLSCCPGVAWIVDVNHLDKPDNVQVHETQTWTGIVFALSEHLQMAVALEAEYADDHMSAPTTNLTPIPAGSSSGRP